MTSLPAASLPSMYRGPPLRPRRPPLRPRRAPASAASWSANSAKPASSPLQLPEPRDDRLQAIAQRLYDQPGNNTSLAGLGQAIGASARTLSRLFHDELGLTFYQWRTQLRIYHALVLLADGHDTTYVAHACGWANPSHFIAAFADLIGTTPGRHRKETKDDRISES